MRPRSRLLVPVAALGLGATLVALPGGCSRGPDAVPAAVRGTVTFQGRPLAGGLVVLSPDPDRGGSGKPARGDVGPDGRYELRLNGEAAIPPGWYRVAVAAAPGPAAGPAFPAKLARPDLSGLVREVKAGRENVFDFAVEVPPG
ncbi:MAG: hypothetical protein C0501_17715 [Isosphaera sp.]|nr:hypothetical protein [Isosphaera sp.]